MITEDEYVYTGVNLLVRIEMNGENQMVEYPIHIIYITPSLYTLYIAIDQKSYSVKVSCTIPYNTCFNKINEKLNNKMNNSVNSRLLHKKLETRRSKINN